MYYGLEDLTVHIGKIFPIRKSRFFKNGKRTDGGGYRGLCIVCLENPHPSQKVCWHLKDEAFTRGNVPMTKEEVRIICIAKLDLGKKMRFFMTLVREQVLLLLKQPVRTAVFEWYAIEKNPEGTELIRKNVQKLRTDNVQIVEGTAPEAPQETGSADPCIYRGSSGNLSGKSCWQSKRRTGCTDRIDSDFLDTMAGSNGSSG